MSQPIQDPRVHALLKGAAQYIGAVQPQVETFEQVRHTMAKRAEGLADVLISRNLLQPGRRDELVTKLATDVNYVYEVALNLASQTGTGSLGSLGGVKLAVDGGKPVDGLTQRFLPGTHA